MNKYQLYFRMLIILLLSLLTFKQGIFAQSPEDTLRNDKEITKDIISLSLTFLNSQKKNGLSFTGDIKEVKQQLLIDTLTPFLSDSMSNRAVWVVNINNAKWSSEKTVGSISKNIKIYIDKETSRLFYIKILNTDLVNNSNAIKPSKSYAENQMLRSEERYTGFPIDMPEISLMDVIESKGLNLDYCKEIVAMHVLHSQLWSEPTPFGYKNKPVWDVHFYGLPPIPNKEVDRSYPLEQRNHRRCIFDAITGSLLFCTTNPQP